MPPAARSIIIISPQQRAESGDDTIRRSVRWLLHPPKMHRRPSSARLPTSRWSTRPQLRMATGEVVSAPLACCQFSAAVAAPNAGCRVLRGTPTFPGVCLECATGTLAALVRCHMSVRNPGLRCSARPCPLLPSVQLRTLCDHNLARAEAHPPRGRAGRCRIQRSPRTMRSVSR